MDATHLKLKRRSNNYQTICRGQYYSYLQNIRPLAATLHSAFLFTCGVVQIELIQIYSVTTSQLNKLEVSALSSTQRQMLSAGLQSNGKSCFHHVRPPTFYLALSFTTRSYSLALTAGSKTIDRFALCSPSFLVYLCLRVE